MPEAVYCCFTRTTLFTTMFTVIIVVLIGRCVSKLHGLYRNVLLLIVVLLELHCLHVTFLFHGRYGYLSVHFSTPSGYWSKKNNKKTTR